MKPLHLYVCTVAICVALIMAAKIIADELAIIGMGVNSVERQVKDTTFELTHIGIPSSPRR